MASKNAPKTLAVCPELTLKDHKEALSVEMNKAGNAMVLMIKMLVGLPETKGADKGKNSFTWEDSGVLILDGAVIEIAGVAHKITVRKAVWKDSRKIGHDAIVVRPVTTKEEKKEADKVEIGF